MAVRYVVKLSDSGRADHEIAFDLADVVGASGLLQAPIVHLAERGTIDPGSAKVDMTLDGEKYEPLVAKAGRSERDAHYSIDVNRKTLQLIPRTIRRRVPEGIPATAGVRVRFSMEESVLPVGGSWIRVDFSTDLNSDCPLDVTMRLPSHSSASAIRKALAKAYAKLSPSGSFACDGYVVRHPVPADRQAPLRVIEDGDDRIVCRTTGRCTFSFDYTRCGLRSAWGWLKEHLWIVILGVIASVIAAFIYAWMVRNEPAHR